MVGEICGEQLKDRKRVKGLMLLLLLPQAPEDDPQKR